jgi:hypothetical protein
MQQFGKNRTSGASLAVVALAIAGTAGYGALVKKRESSPDAPPRTPQQDFAFRLKLLERGSGLAPVPTAPPAAAWFKFALTANGQPVYHRPVQFRKRAWDTSGRPLVTEHRWSDGHFYVFIRSGFRKSTGPVTLEISFRERLVEHIDVGSLPQPHRQLVAGSTPPRWPGLKCEVVRLPEGSPVPLGILADVPLRAHEALVVQHVGTTFLAKEPYSEPTIAKAKADDRPDPVPLPVGYPNDIDAVSLRVRHLRARPVKRIVEFGLRFQGESPSDYQYSIQSEIARFAGGVSLAMSRFDRTALVSKYGRGPFRLAVVGYRVSARSSVRLISPRTVNGVPIELRNRLMTGENDSKVLPPAPDGGDVHPRVEGQIVPVRVEIEVWSYEPIHEETIVVSVDPKRARTVTPRNRWHLTYLP